MFAIRRALFHHQQRHVALLSTTANNQQQQQNKLSKWIRYAIGGTAAWLTIYLADAWINDDLDLVFGKFRTRITPEESAKRPHVVILGAGWASLSMLRKLHCDKFKVTVISPRNYFLFTPLLPSTTTGTLSPRSIVEPIRQFCKRSRAEEANFIEAACLDIDSKNNVIYCEDNSAVKGSTSKFEMKYDYLVVAVGAEPATFGIPGVEENAIFMKDVHHTAKIRDRILDCLESACIPGQPESEIQRLLHFVVVGGGPSGVEFAAEMRDFIKHDMVKAFPEHKGKVKVTLIEALPRILTMFDKNLVDYTEKNFNKSHINVLTQSAVKNVAENQVTIQKADGTMEVIPYGALVWVTGNSTNKLISKLIANIGDSSQPNKRALLIDQYLRVNGAKNIFSLGDCSFMKLPATAQVASQQGRYLGTLFNELSEDFYKKHKGEINDEELDKKIQEKKGFEYKHLGMFAYVGGHEAIAQLGGQDSYKSSGVATFFLWRSVYFSKLLSSKNRFLVLTDWLKTEIFGRDISRA
jgi:NADH:ubiquinone reductase (non-electrogenic)